MGGGKGGQTIGYHYLFGVLFGVCRGPVNEFVMIKSSDKVVWEGNACDDEVQVINKPDLFGGDEKEGGIQGLFRVFMGAPDQVLPGASANTFIGSSGPNKNASLPAVKTALGGRMGELRGRACVWYDGLLSSINPYIKEWIFRVRRTWAGWDGDTWYPEKATIFLTGTSMVTEEVALANPTSPWAVLALLIMGENGKKTAVVSREGSIHAMNPAHILYECSTNRSWGRGAPRTLMGNTWVYAANLFCAEGLGLCLKWQRRDDISEFIQTVLDHCGAVVYTDRETGLIEIKPLRDDYDIADLPHFTPDSGLIRVIEDDSGSSEGIADEVIVQGLNPIDNQMIDGRAHNLGVRHSHNGSATSVKEYKGLPTKDLCNRVADRDLTLGAAGLRKFTVTLDRSGFKIYPGAVIKISYPPRNIVEMVLRVGEIDEGDMLNGEIKLKTVQDVFSLKQATWVTPTETEYEPTYDGPIAPTDQTLFEPGYYDMYRAAATTGDTDQLAALTADDTFMAAVVGRPAVTNTGYDLLTRPAGDPDFETENTFYFTANAVLTDAITATQTSFDIEQIEDFPANADLVGDSLVIDEERMRIESFDGTTIMVERGCMDTWPVEHAAEARIWLPDDDVGSDGVEYLVGETVEAKALTRATGGRLLEADADLMSLELIGRVFRPYPPADVKVDGDSIYAMSGEYNEPAFTWVERNRVTQADQLVGFFEAAMAHEAGTTYRLRVYENEADLVELGEHDGITSGFVYDAALQAADLVATSSVWVELVSVRDGVESWKPKRFRVVLQSGYGYGYGLNYGGA